MSPQDDDDLKRQFDEESSRIDVPEVDAGRLAKRAVRRRRMRAASTTVGVVGLVVGSLVVAGVIRDGPGTIELLQPATGSGEGGPVGSPMPSEAPSAKPSPGTARPSPDSSPASERRFDPAISTDGRYVAYVAGEVFVFDRRTDKREVVSITDGGRRIDGSKPQISSNGRHVAFLGANGIVYLRDRTAKETTVVSVSTGNANVAALMAESALSMSADGRYVAFSGTSASLVEADTNSVEDVFVRDLIEETTTRVSVSSSGEQANGRSAFPDISSDGRFIAFQSYATNLHGGEHPECTSDVCPQIYVHDLQTGETLLASLSSSGEIADRGGRHPSISADGRNVAFDSASGNLGPAPPDGNAHDIFLRNRANGQTRELSSAHETCNCTFPHISDDGTRVTYGTFSLGLRVFDVPAGSERRVGSYSGGALGFTGDGRLVVYANSQRRIVVLDIDGGGAETLP